MPELERLTCSIDENQIATVVLNRPDKLNAIDGDVPGVNNMVSQLKNTEIRAVIVKAWNRLCSGLDVKSLLTSKSGAMKLLFKWLPTLPSTC